MYIISLNSLNRLAILTNTDPDLCEVRTKLLYNAWLRVFHVEARVPYPDSARKICGKRSDRLFTEYFDFPASNNPAVLHINLYPIKTRNRKNKEQNTRKLKTKQCSSRNWVVLNRKLNELRHSSENSVRTYITSHQISIKTVTSK